MSTKIFYAYRIPKQVDVLKKLKTLKEMATEQIANNRILLGLIHVHVLDDAKREYEKDPSNHMAKYALEDNEKGIFDDFWAERVLEKAQRSLIKSHIDIYFECSIFYDNDFWYIKFFPNNKIYENLLGKLENLGFEDYHYQNQTDPPEDIPFEEYEKRGEIWDALLDSADGNYRDGFLYTIFDACEFKKLISRNYYTGNPLYEHLAYDFGNKLKTIEEK